MNRSRASSGLVAVEVVSLIVMPLHFACAILVSESSMQPESFVRMVHARNELWWLFLVLQVGAGWLLVKDLILIKPFALSCCRLSDCR